MTLSQMIKDLANRCRGQVILELETEDFSRIYQEAEEEMDKAGMMIIADSRYLDGTPSHEGRRLQYPGLMIKEKL